MQIDNVINRTAGVVDKVLQRISTQLGDVGESAPRRRLTLTEQRDRFLAMSDAEFAELRQERGDAEVENYIRAMMKLTGSE